MENKSYSVSITQKDHLSFIIHELRFHALLVSIIAFLGFGAYSVFFVLNASPKFNTITVLNIITNLVIVLAAVAAANVLLYFLCNYFAAQRAQREARFGMGELTLADDSVSYTSDASEIKVKWSCIQHVTVSKKQFIFYVNSGLTFFIPTSCLSAEQTEEIKQILLSKTTPDTVLATAAPETEEEFLDKLFGEDTFDDNVEETAEETAEESAENQ